MPESSAAVLLLFLNDFPLGLYLRLVMVESGVWVLLLVIHLMREVTWFRLTRKTHVSVPSVNNPDPQLQSDGKDCAPLPPKEWGVRPACLAIFFLELELGEVFAPGDTRNLPSGGKGVGFLTGWSVQPKGSVHWH